MSGRYRSRTARFASLAGPKVPAEHALQGLGIWVQSAKMASSSWRPNTPGGIAASAARGAAPPKDPRAKRSGPRPGGATGVRQLIPVRGYEGHSGWPCSDWADPAWPRRVALLAGGADVGVLGRR